MRTVHVGVDPAQRRQAAAGVPEMQVAVLGQAALATELSQGQSQNARGTHVMPRRIQRQRVKGWRIPAGAVYVGRPTKWGNPFRVGALDPYHAGLVESEKRMDADAAVQHYAARYLGDNLPDRDEIIAELRGRDLVCWCPPGQPCHADVLLRIANR